MGVYINTEMPKNGSCIQIVIDDDGKVYPSVEKCILKMGSIAKAVLVPPHGRLVNADRLGMTDFEIVMCNGDYKELVKMILEKIENAPTIIPAWEGE